MGITAFIQKYLLLLLLGISAIVSLFIFRDYGISWDENGSHEIGTLNYEYLLSKNDKLLTYSEKDYGIAFELPLVFIEKMLGLKDNRSTFMERHLLTHLFFLLSAGTLFLLINLLYNNKLLATTGFLMLVLNPLMYGHSFINSKDIPFMGMFIICFYLCALAFKTGRNRHFILFAIASGLLINMRIVGIMMAACAMVLLLINCVNDRTNLKQHLLHLLLYSVIAVTTLYVSWPYLWDAPLHNFSLALQRMSKYTWYGTVLFRGAYIHANELPGDYLPVWFGITTPLVYLLVGALGIIILIISFFRTPLRFFTDSVERNTTVYLVCMLTPALAAILLHSTLYDSWRHLFFIYPSFILISIYGLNRLMNTKIKVIAFGTLLLGFAFSLFHIIQNHPFQQVYFNSLTDTHTPEHLRYQYELDYWGSSYKQSYEYLLDHDPSPVINVAVQNEPGLYNLAILTAEQYQRIRLTDVKDASYFITNYRWHPQAYTEFSGREWHTFKVQNNSINTIFKLR